MLPTVAATSTHPVKGIACMVGGGALLTFNDAIMKWVSDSYPVGQMLFMRNGFALIVLVGVAIWLRSLTLFRIRNFKGQALRASALIASAFFFFTGLKSVPLASAVVITFSGPLIITALAPALLGEEVGWRRWVAVVVGFAGVLIIIRPGTAAFHPALLLILMGTLGGALRDLITRRLCATETSLSILAFTVAAIALAGLVTLPLGWAPVRVHDLGLFAVTGVLLAGAHYLLIEALRFAEAALVAPFKYANIVWALIIGYVLWGDLPDRWTMAGAAVIVASGLYILERESRLRRQRRKGAR